MTKHEREGECCAKKCKFLLSSTCFYGSMLSCKAVSSIQVIYGTSKQLFFFTLMEFLHLMFMLNKALFILDVHSLTELEQKLAMDYKIVSRITI